MPFIRFSVLKHCTLFTASISLNREIISSYFCYVEKGLVYITIVALFSRQPAFYLKCTKTNTYSLYNIYLVSVNK